MMKFAGEIKQAKRRTNRISKWDVNDIPTVDEVDDVMAPMIADTILQILRGQGIYYGWEIERDIDNYIPPSKGSITVDKQEQRREQRRWLGENTSRLRRAERRLTKIKIQLEREMNRQQKIHNKRLFYLLVKYGRDPLVAKQMADSIIPRLEINCDSVLCNCKVPSV
jgi:hypothetical protein